MNTQHGPTDPLTPCPHCNGGTYTFQSGSVWCPNEACQPGGRFIVRVAFERRPNDLAEARLRARGVKSIAPRAIKSPAPKADDGFAKGLDDFIGK
jgi:hypothetical protein